MLPAQILLGACSHIMWLRAYVPRSVRPRDGHTYGTKWLSWIPRICASCDDFGLGDARVNWEPASRPERYLIVGPRVCFPLGPLWPRSRQSLRCNVRSPRQVYIALSLVPRYPSHCVARLTETDLSPIVRNYSALGGQRDFSTRVTASVCANMRVSAKCHKVSHPGPSLHKCRDSPQD